MIGIGTLLHRAEQAGLDLSPWRALAHGVTPVGNPLPAASPFFQPACFAPSWLRKVSWLAPGIFMRGELTILAGQPGSSKTTCAMHLAVAIASGRRRIGPISIEKSASGYKVAFISAEEDVNGLRRMAAGAAMSLKLNKFEIVNVWRNLKLHGARASGWRATADRLEELQRELVDTGFGLVVLDTAASLMELENENDNGAVTRSMTALGRMADACSVAVMLVHHTPKQTSENAAAQRGEITLVRGGGAFVAAARVVLTITTLPPVEAGLALAAGCFPEDVRRLEHAKINDQRRMAPAFLEIHSQQIEVNDGTKQVQRAVRFVDLAAAAAANPHQDARRDTVMRAVDAGAHDDQGAWVPLSPPGSGGRKNLRDAARHAADALRQLEPKLPEAHAETVAKDILKDLIGRECISEKDVRLPKYRAHGKPDGTRPGKGLVCDWTKKTWGDAEPAGDAPGSHVVSPEGAPPTAPGAAPVLPRPPKPHNRTTAEGCG